MKNTACILLVSALAGLSSAAPAGHKVSARFTPTGAVIQIVGGDSVNGVKYVSCDMYSMHCVGTSDPQKATKFVIHRDAADTADQLLAMQNPNLCLNVWEGDGQVNLWQCGTNVKDANAQWIDTNNGQPQPTQMRALDGRCLWFNGENGQLLAAGADQCNSGWGNWQLWWRMDVLLQQSGPGLMAQDLAAPFNTAVTEGTDALPQPSVGLPVQQGSTTSTGDVQLVL